jgi:anti-sigma B factor antagonist
MVSNWEWLDHADDAASVLVVRGELDVAVGGAFVAAVNEALGADPAPSQVVIELGEVEFIDSSGLRALLQLQQEHGDRVQIGDVSPAVRRLFELTGTLEHFGREGGTA